MKGVKIIGSIMIGLAVLLIGVSMMHARHQTLTSKENLKELQEASMKKGHTYTAADF